LERDDLEYFLSLEGPFDGFLARPLYGGVVDGTEDAGASDGCTEPLESGGVVDGIEDAGASDGCTEPLESGGVVGGIEVSVADELGSGASYG
jgi:hypothetical protein